MNARVPAGFVARQRGAETLLLDPALEAGLEAAGLARLSGWVERLRAAPLRGGRGGTARAELPGGAALRIKALRRGGWLAPLWRERQVGWRRALRNLALPGEVRARGIATPAVRALLVLAGPPGLVRAWVASDEIEGARDLAECLREGGGPAALALAAGADLARRMHERGVEHGDLNLGNLLVREDRARSLEAFVVDLDGARLWPGPVPFRVCQRELRRLERSLVKLGAGTDLARRRDGLYEAYAGDDGALAARLAGGRRLGALRLAVHRGAWIGRRRGT